MKKYLLLILLLLVPFIAKAEVKITKAELVSAEEGVDADKNPTFKGLQFDFNINFTKVNQIAKYKLTIKNDTNKDYEIDTGSRFSKGEYIKYEFILEDNDNTVIKAGKEKTIYLLIAYVKEMPYEVFKDGKYQEKKTMTINLSNNNEDVNPNTKVGYYLLALSLIAFIALLTLIISKYRLDKLMILLIGIIIGLPITIYALEKLSVEINANITVETDLIRVKYLHCEFPIVNDTGLTTENNILEENYLFRKDSGVRNYNEEEFKILNKNKKPMDWSSELRIYPIEFYTCINKKENVLWRVDLTEEELAKHNEYMENFNACLQEEYDYTNLSPLTYNYYYEDAENLPFFDDSRAVYYEYNGCIERT